jgi:hypothetical protein
MNGGVLTIMLLVKVNAWGWGFIRELFATFIEWIKPITFKKHNFQLFGATNM